MTLDSIGCDSLLNVCGYLDLPDLLRARRVCRNWRQLIDNPPYTPDNLWKPLFERLYPQHPRPADYRRELIQAAQWESGKIDSVLVKRIHAHCAPICAMTTDETEIVTADKKGCLRIWERSPAANLLCELTTPTPVKRLKLTPRLLIALCATEIIAWQRSDYKRLEELKFPKVDSDAQIECDEELLALLNDNRVQIIDLKEGKIKRGFSNDDKIYAIALRQGVLAIAEGRSIFCKNLKTDRTEIRRLPYLLQNCVTALCCDESGAVACINSRGDAGLWEKDIIESPS